MKLKGVFISFLFIYVGCSLNNASFSKWEEVKFPEANFKVSCLEKQKPYEIISVNFDEKRKAGTLYCNVEQVVFFVYTNEWNVDENADENSRRFFSSLVVLGVRDDKKIQLPHAGEKAVQNIDPEFRVIEQYFLIGKRSYHLSVSFQEIKTINTKAGEFSDVSTARGELSENELEIAKRFFNSFQVLDK